MVTNSENIKSQMRKGMLEYCVLLKLSHGKFYPSDIIKSLDEVGLIVVEATIYTLLSRLRREGKLEYEWQESPKGPPRKYFYITDYGRDALVGMTEAWDEISNAINQIRNN
ncbi:MAG: PadR family transcriptional regulator [Muribaculaceae bacterium]|nr:PadR family transcriptional regulator [Muribaculaceae bacterium]